MMKTKIITEINDFIAMESDWNELVRDSEFNDPFNSWCWYKKWWEYFGDGRGLYIVASFDESNRLMAVAPLWRREKKIKGIKVNELLFMSNFISPYNSIIYRKSTNSMNHVVNIFEYLQKYKEQWDIISLVNIDSSLPYVNQIKKHMNKLNFKLIINTELHSPYIEINKDFSHYLKDKFDSKSRNDIKRSIKKTNKEGKCIVVKNTDEDELLNSLEQAFDISKRSWKGSIGTNFGGSEAHRNFYRDIINYFGKKGQVAIWTLTINGKSVAFEFQIVNDGKIYLLINDFDKDYSKQSPGIALLYYVIENCHDQGFKEFDFCGDSYDYKKKWSHGERKTISIQIFNNRILSIFIYICKQKILPLFRSIKGLMKQTLK